MERWEQAADAQVELAEYYGSDLGQRHADSFFRVHLGREDVQSNAITMFTPEGRRFDLGYGEQIWVNLKVAEPIYVSPEMMSLVEAAAPSFALEPLIPEDLITPSGFIYLPTPMYTLDRHGKRTAYRALSWYPIQRQHNINDETHPAPGGATVYGNYDGVLVTFFSHVDDDDDYIEEFREAYEGGMSAWAIVHSSIIWFGEDMLPEVGEVYSASDRSSVISFWRPLHAMLRLMQQYISTRDRYRPPRSTRRRMERAAMPERDVTVIRLRRPKSKGTNEPHHVEWSHQWLVGGHWRNQWFPSLNMHRQIYIAPYIKGPEDKPLRIREKRVFEFVR